MPATCEECGERFEAKRSTAKYCSTRCRTRATRRRAEGRPAPAAEPRQVPAPAEDVPLLVAATIDELAKAERLSTALGQTAVKLAERIGSRSETGSAVASLSKELRATMAEALRGSAAAADPIDELRARRDRKRRAG